MGTNPPSLCAKCDFSLGEIIRLRTVKIIECERGKIRTTPPQGEEIESSSYLLGYLCLSAVPYTIFKTYDDGVANLWFLSGCSGFLSSLDPVSVSFNDFRNVLLCVLRVRFLRAPRLLLLSFWVSGLCGMTNGKQ